MNPELSHYFERGKQNSISHSKLQSDHFGEKTNNSRPLTLLNTDKNSIMGLEGSTQLYIVSITMIILSGITVLTRTYVRAVMIKNIGPEDYLMIVAWLLGFVVVIIHLQRKFSISAVLQNFPCVILVTCKIKRVNKKKGIILKR